MSYMINKNEIARISTKISGLDKILYGGLDFIRQPFCIVIRGGAGSESTLFGLQLLYGIALSLCDNGYKNPVIPTFLSSCHNVKSINTLMIDTFISSCLYSMTNEILEKSYKGTDFSTLTRLLFNTSSIVCECVSSEETIPLPVSTIKNEPDRLIAESVMYYNNRTGALHFRTDNNIADLSNLVYWRKHASLNSYLRDPKSDINGPLYKLLHTRILKTNIVELPQTNCLPIEKLQVREYMPLLALELDNTTGYDTKDMRLLLNTMKQKAKVSILIVDNDTNIPANNSDVLIDLYNKTQNGYVLHYLNLTHCSHQDAMLGEHQYKKRDFGIEVFPNVHTYFKIKKNLHRSLIYTHSSIIEDTFPQYLSRKKQIGDSNASYDDYVKNKDTYTKENLEALHPFDNIKLLSYDILQKIFLSKEIGNKTRDNKDFYKNESGLVTAVIGLGNTFKRYLTTGSAFSSAVRNEDTLIIILNKEKHLVQKRMACPARLCKNSYKPQCEGCYKHFHFMNIYPENITCNEFAHMLSQRIKHAFDSKTNRCIKRIIIDDLQILDFCFPLLKGGDDDFLNVLMNICRENDISLYILCDKEAKSRDRLKAMADNVVCTEKTDKGQPKILVERCSGYYNPPSKMYCGIIKNIEDLFLCEGQKGPQYPNGLRFSMNSLQIEDEIVYNIDSFWKK